MDPNLFFVILPGLILLVFAVIAQEYWREMRDFNMRALDWTLSEKIRIDHAKNRDRALTMFQIICIGTLICLIFTIIPLYIPAKAVMRVVKIGLLIDSLFLVVLLVRFIFRCFHIRYLKLNDLIETIKSDKK